MSTTVVVAGGDPRDRWLCLLLHDRGYHLRTWGMAIKGLPAYQPDQDPAPNILIGPMTGIGGDGRMQVAHGIVTLPVTVMENMGAGAVIAAGLIASPTLDYAQAAGIRTVQYRKESSFMWLNAVPTAEGAIQAAIGLSGRTLYDRPLAVIGFGRVGSVLGLRLQAYGAHVTVYDRSLEKRAMARAYGFPAFPLATLPREIDGIFNTVPAPILDEHWITDTGNAWIIDLASNPGGLTPAMREHPALSGRYQWVLGLPGQIAPARAAEIIWETLSLVLD